ncbi:MAG: hypothetical protein IJ863_05585, partial [Spirochaetales bacterium]|nr:hypothetical protein [Spirochaetales bacterium]
RNGFILERKYRQFLLPSILSYIAMSLNEFVDGILVSQMLGSDAMALVNMASPVMFVFSFTFMFLGVGGSIIYAESCGKQDRKQAGTVYTVTICAALFATLLLVSLGMLFLGPLSKALCHDAGSMAEFTDYLRFLVMSGLLIIPLMSVTCFMSAMGRPRIGTAINIIANTVNLVMDYVYIHFLHTGLKGAAMATLTGYLASALFLIALVALKRIVLPFAKIGIRDFKRLGTITARGGGSSLGQIGYCIKVAFCNGYAARLAGMEGVTVFSLCIQVISIASILIGSSIDAMTPIMASLYGQKDFKGIRLLLRTTMLLQLLLNSVLVALFELFPNIVLSIYNIPSAYTASATLGIRILSLMFIFRGFILVFISYFQVMDRKVYALLVSVTDGVVGIVALALILGSLFGVNGIWMAFTANSILLLLGILAANAIISARSHGRFEGLFLMENDPESIPVYDATVRMKDPKAFDLVSRVEEFCVSNGIERRRSVMISLSVEEMISYTMEHSSLDKDDHIDVLLKIMDDQILIYFRSIGQPFNTASAPVGEFSNIDVLTKVASSIDFSYVMGLNQTRVILDRG